MGFSLSRIRGRSVRLLFTVARIGELMFVLSLAVKRVWRNDLDGERFGDSYVNKA